MLNKINDLKELIPIVLTSYKHTQLSLDFIDYSVKIFSKLCSDRGLVFAIKYFKRTRLHYTRFLSGHPLLIQDGVKIQTNGLPNWISKYVSTDDSPLHIKGILTGLTISRCFNTKPKLDLSPIISPWKGYIPQITSGEFNHISRELGLKIGDVRFTKYHYTTKKGPNGPALISSMIDLTLLPEPLKEDLAKLGGEKLGLQMKYLISKNQRFHISLSSIWQLMFPTTNKGKFRKLSYFSDREGKTRVIGILDYWTQTALVNLHNHLNGILKKIPNDCTFNQDHFRSCLPKTGPYYSFDLSNATDRMPLSLQKMVLSRCMRKDLPEIWGRILTGYEFHTQGGQSCKYNTGQPMGAYSSWPAMALTHHFIVKWSALKVGLPHFKDYALLGDDIVIANADVARSYKELLTALDMPISEAKSHVSDDTYEFAKRWIYRNTEVTAYSFSGLLETWKSYSLFENFLETQQQHSWLYGEGAIPGKVLYDVMCFFGKSQQAARTLKLFNIHTLLGSIMKSDRADVEAVKTLSSLLALPYPTWKSYPLDLFIEDIIVQVRAKQSENEVMKLRKTSIEYAQMLFSRTEASRPQAWPSRAILSLLLEFNPVSQVINDLHMETLKKLQVLYNGTPHDVRELLLSNDLVGASINLGVFSMRASRSRILTKSMLVKGVWSEWREYIHGSEPNTF